MFKFRAIDEKVFVPILLAVLVGMFWLPWHVGVRPTTSVSYLLGFSNQAAWLFFLVFLALFTFLGPRFSPTETAEGGLGRYALYIALAGTFLSTGLMYFMERPVAGYGEAGYFCDRINHLLAGGVPYRDFEFAYGPALLYAPASLARVLHGDLRDAYGITYVAACLAGVYFLWATCNWLDGTIAGRRSAFLFVWAASLVSTLNYGLNYSLLRFIFPVFWLLFVYRMARRKGPSSLAPYLAVIAGFSLMTSISPELGIALALGSMLSLAVIGRLTSPRQTALLAATLIVLVAIGSFAFTLGIYGTMFAIRGGYLNLPVVPGPYILLLLTAAAVTSCIVGAQMNKARHGTALPLLCYTLLASAAALGRCDGGHVLLNGLAVFLCAIVATRGTPIFGTAFLWSLWLAYFLPVAEVAPSISQLIQKSLVPAIFALEPRGGQTRFDLLILRHKESLLGADQGKAAFLQVRAAAQGQPAPNFDKIFAQPEGTVFEVPFDFAIDGYGRYQSPALDSGFFMGLTDVGTKLQVQRKVDELRAYPQRPLLLPLNWTSECTAAINFDKRAVSTLVLFPLNLPERNHGSVYGSYCSYIEQHYRLSSPADQSHLHYALWTAKVIGLGTQQESPVAGLAAERTAERY